MFENGTMPKYRQQMGGRCIVLATLIVVIFFRMGLACAASKEPLELLIDKGQTLPVAFDEWTLSSFEANPRTLTYLFTHKTYGPLRVMLQHRDDRDRSFGRTKSFNILYEGQPADDKHGQAIGALMERIIARIDSRDDGSLTLKPLPRLGYDPPGKAPEHELTIASPDRTGMADGRLYLWLDRYERHFSGILLFLSLLGVLFLVVPFRRKLAALSTKERWILFFLLFVAALVRAVIPSRLVMVYGGYPLINQAIYFSDLLRYGGGTPVFYHLFMHVLPFENEQAFLVVNTIVGWVTLPFVWLWVLRKFPKQSGMALWFAVILAFHPMLLKDHNSESNLIPTLFFFFLGLNHWFEFRSTKSRRHFIFALAALGLAVLSRPLMMFFVPLTLVIDEVFSSESSAGITKNANVLGGLALMAVLLLPHVGFIYTWWEIEQRFNLSAGLSGLVIGLVEVLSPLNLYFHPGYSPFVLPLVVVAAFVLTPKGRRAPLWRFAALALLFYVPYSIDKPPPSMPRLQIPALYFLSALSAVGLHLVWRKAVEIHRTHLAAFSLLLLGTVGMLWPFATLWTKGNDQTEHEALVEVAQHLPQGRVTLGVLKLGDPPYPWGIYFEYPDYLWRSPSRDVRRLGLGELVSRVRRETLQREGYVYLGIRCYALMWEKPPEGVGSQTISVASEGIDDTYVHPACKMVREKLELQPVFEWNALNLERQGDFIWYPDRETLPVGLYRVLGMKSSPKTAK